MARPEAVRGGVEVRCHTRRTSWCAMHWEERFRQAAAAQEGLVGRCSLPRLGCTSDHWWQARRNGRWEAVSPRVLRLRGAPPTDGQRALAAVLDAHPCAALHGPSALAWFGFRGFDLREIHVARPRGRSGAGATLGTLHELRHLRAHDVTLLRGVPTQTPLRAIWSEAARYSPEPLFDLGLRRVGRLLDDAHVLGLAPWAALHEMVDDIHERGRAGSTLMRVLAAARPPGSSPTESRLEDRLAELLGPDRSSALVRQRHLGGAEQIGRVDLRDRQLPLAIEVNSLAYHSTPSDRAADELRYAALVDAGFTVAVVWEGDLWRRTHGVVRVIDQARRAAASGRPAVLHTPGCPWPGVSDRAA
jgi:hypothetical protein